MTKKHYEAIAAILKARYYGDPYDDGDNAVRSIAIALTNLFAQDNPKFDRERFLEACGVHTCRVCGGNCPETLCDNVPL